MQQKWLYDGSFPLCRSEGESLIAKKVAKKLGFLFLRLANRRDGANPAKDESLTHQNQGIHQESNKKPPEGGFHSQINGWASRIRTYITGTKNQGPAIGRWPSVCHKAFCDYNVSGMVKPNKQPIRQNATTQYEHHPPYTEKGEPIALLAPKTLRRLRQQR